MGPVLIVNQALGLIEDGRPDAAVLNMNLGGSQTVDPVADVLGALGVPYLLATGDVSVSGADGSRTHPWLEKQYLEAELIRALMKLVTAS